MNVTIAAISVIPLIIGILLMFKMIKDKRYLDNNETIDGILEGYERSGKRLHPIITYVKDGQEKMIKQGGVTNLKLIKKGSTVRITSIGNGKLVTDFHVKADLYYAIAFILGSALVFIASFIA